MHNHNMMQEPGDLQLAIKLAKWQEPQIPVGIVDTGTLAIIV